MNLLKKVRALFSRRRLDAEMTEEMRLHREQRIAEQIANGRPRAEAERICVRAFGPLEQIKEEAREQRAGLWLEQAGQDLRHASRQLWRARGFASVVIATLGLGIGATAAIYSVIDAAIINPVPGADADRLMRVGVRRIFDKQDTFLPGVTYPVYEPLAHETGLYSELAWSTSWQADLQTAEFPVISSGTLVSSNFFSLLHARPALGRGIVPGEEVPLIDGSQPAAAGVVVLSYRWWRTQFAGDPAIVGQKIRLGGYPFTVVGVMPESFEYPRSTTAFWIPSEPPFIQPQVMSLATIDVILRLKDGVSREQGEAMLAGLRQRLFELYPAGDRWYGDDFRRLVGFQLWLRPLAFEFGNGSGAEAMRRTLFGLLVAIGCVFVIVCANVANMALARTEQRQQEFLMRATLGAGRGRLVRQVMTEYLLLSAIGGVFSIAIARWAVALLDAANPMPRLRPVDVDLRLLAAALVVALGAGLLCGIIPAWQAARLGTAGSARVGHGASPGAAARRFQSTLVVLQIGLAAILLAGAGLMVRSVFRLLDSDPGFAADGLYNVYLPLPGRYSNPRDLPGSMAAKSAFYDAALARFSHLPGVRQVALLTVAGVRDISIPERTAPVRAAGSGISVGSMNYLDVMKVPRIEGRPFTGMEPAGGVQPVAINRAMAELCWPGETAIGRRFSRTYPDKMTFEVVAVYADAWTSGLLLRPLPMYFMPYGLQTDLAEQTPRLALRTSGVVPVEAILQELKALEPGLRNPQVVPLEQTLYNATAAHRLYRNYLLLFASVGLAVAAIGVYGVLAYSVTRRTREIGIRTAIGATRGQICRMIIGDAARLIAFGLAGGLVAALALTRLIQPHLYGVEPNDPATYLLTAVVLLLAGLLAASLPARRAARVDPMTALRAE